MVGDVLTTDYLYSIAMEAHNREQNFFIPWASVGSLFDLDICPLMASSFKFSQTCQFFFTF